MKGCYNTVVKFECDVAEGVVAILWAGVIGECNMCEKARCEKVTS